MLEGRRSREESFQEVSVIVKKCRGRKVWRGNVVEDSIIGKKVKRGKWNVSRGETPWRGSVRRGI